MNTLSDYYKATGGTLGKTVAERFADPNFAKAAEMAGFSSSTYTINSNNADANTKILNNLKVLKESGGTQSTNTGAVQTTGNQTTKDAQMTNNVNNWLNGINANPSGANATNPTPTGNTGGQNSSTIDFSNTPYTTDVTGQKKYFNSKTGQYDIMEASATSPKIERTSTDPLTTAFYDAVDQQNAFAEQQVNSLYKQLEPARTRLNTANLALVDRIKDNFDQARKAQEDVNSRLLAGTEKMGYISGRSRYTPETQQGIMAKEMQNGIDRITELNVQEADLIAKAEAARAEDDFNMLYKVWSEYNNVRTKTNEVVADLYKNSVTAQKNALDAQLKTIEANKQSVLDQVRVLESVAPAIAEQYAKMPANLQETFLQKLATQYDVDVNQIKGAIINYTNERADKKKTASASGAGSTLSERQAYKENAAYSDVDSLMSEENFGFTVDGKTEPVQLKDGNGYITPQGFRLLNSRVLRPAGISREDFIKQYPELFYTRGTEFDNYGLTANEVKILKGNE